MRIPAMLLQSITLLLLLPRKAGALQDLLPPLAVAHQHTMLSQAPSMLNHASTVSSSFPSLYMTALAMHPLATKMLTGASLALTGDWIAQNSQQEEEAYDQRRAASFALFDSAYRASQHFLYPLVVAHCQGQFLAALPGVQTSTAAALEQTLVSQLVIVPLLYYPVFYGVTSFVQGLDWQGTVERAQQTFVPLLKRNLLFWIPVQFVQFSFLPDELQIPFLSVCGLAWTLILSVMAGSAHKKVEPPETTAAKTQEDYCVTGMEDCCHIGDKTKGLFPDTSLQEITEDMVEMAQEVTQEWEEMTQKIWDEEPEEEATTAEEAKEEKKEELVVRK